MATPPPRDVHHLISNALSLDESHSPDAALAYMECVAAVSSQVSASMKSADGRSDAAASQLVKLASDCLSRAQALLAQPHTTPTSDREASQLGQSDPSALHTGAMHARHAFHHGHHHSDNELLMSSFDMDPGEMTVPASSARPGHLRAPHQHHVSYSGTNWTSKEHRQNLENLQIMQRHITEKYCDHLVLVVHGIGDQLVAGDTIGDRVQYLRNLSSQMCKVHFPKKRVQVSYEHVEWHSILHSLPEVDKVVEAITLDHSGRIRSTLNHTVLDVMLYMTPRYHDLILAEVGSQLNAAYTKFVKENPYFSGRVSLFAHSLGSVISLDLLLDPRAGQPGSPIPGLLFPVDNVFALGSPFGLFLVTRDATPEILAPVLENTAIYNIFDQCDPVAYRWEPLLDPAFEDVPPKPIPFHKDLRPKAGGAAPNPASVASPLSKSQSNPKLTQTPAQESGSNLLPSTPKTASSTQADSTTTATSRGASVTESIRDESLRLDYKLPASGFDSLSETISAMQAHGRYWTSKNSLLFVLSKLVTNVEEDDVVLQRYGLHAGHPGLTAPYLPMPPGGRTTSGTSSTTV